MIRLAVLYHDDIREPVAVAVQEVAHAGRGIFWLHEDFSHAGVNPAGDVYGSGPEAEACKALLLRERAHWLAAHAADLAQGGES